MTDLTTLDSPFAARYGSDDMRRLWSDAHRRSLWRRVWVALAEAEAEAHNVADVHGHTSGATAPMQLGTSATPLHASPPAAAVAAERQRQELEPMMRAQMAARLRDDPVLPEVRQFLLGPWLQVIVKAYAEHGEESAETQRALGAVESFIDGGSYRRRWPLAVTLATAVAWSSAGTSGVWRK